MATFTGPSLGPDGWLRDKHLPPNLRAANMPGFLASEAADPASPLAGELSATYALGGGTSRTITGPTLPDLPPGTEYIWNKTDGAGTLLDIVSGVA